MFDTNLLFSNAAVTTTTGNSASLNIAKTPAKGVTVEIAVTNVGGTTSPTLDAVVYESNDDSAYNAIATFAQITAVGRFTRLVQSKKKYLRLTYTIGGTGGPTFTVTSGIVSGAPGDMVS